MRALALASLTAFPLIFAAATASAQEPPAPPVNAPVSQTDDDSWTFRYGEARNRLLAGDFHEAASMFAELARDARDPSKRALAEAQAALAREWEVRGMTLVRRDLLREHDLNARSVNERTTDELAVLYLNSVLYGIGTGTWTAVLTKPDSNAGWVLPILGFTGATVGTVALIDSSQRLPYGVPQSIVAGMYVGFEEGLALTLWNQAGDSSQRWKDETFVTLMWGASTAGALAGAAIGASVGTTPGRASFVGTAALWSGVVSGLAVTAVQPSNGASARGPMLAASLGIGAGAIGGMLAAGPVSPSIARVRFLDLGAIGGGLLFGGVYLAAANRDGSGQAGAGITALGIASGLAVAWYATSSMPQDRPEDRAKEATKPVSWSPSLLPSKDGAMLGVAGSF